MLFYTAQFNLITPFGGLTRVNHTIPAESQVRVALDHRVGFCYSARAYLFALRQSLARGRDLNVGRVM